MICLVQQTLPDLPTFSGAIGMGLQSGEIIYLVAVCNFSRANAELPDVRFGQPHFCEG
jgi:hypothetical protein